MFSEQERAFLQAQPLVRIATVDHDGQPTADVVGFQFDGARLYIGGHQLQTTRKYKNIMAGNRKVSLFIDDLKSLRPWQPGGIRIHGRAEVVQRQGHLSPGSYLAITPVVSWSWGIEEAGSEQGLVGPKKSYGHEKHSVGKSRRAPGEERSFIWNVYQHRATLRYWGCSLSPN
jgi:pyridoxamine 5'-phosphate oxidase family protein